jgi:hypothetical protein
MLCCDFEKHEKNPAFLSGITIVGRKTISMRIMLFRHGRIQMALLMQR